MDWVEWLVGFLECVDSFDGVFLYFLNGMIGCVLFFMVGDDGGDLVEMVFLMLGLLGVVEYFVELGICLCI